MKTLRDMTEGELRLLMDACAKAINSKLAAHLDPNAKPMFALLVFDDPEVAQYISSCERSCMIEALRETADRLESRSDVTR